MTQFRTILLLLSLNLLMAACATHSPSGSEKISEEAYLEVLDKNTAKVQQYDGLQNTLELGVTFVTSSVQEAQLKRQSTLLQWSEADYQQEKVKRGEENLKHTEFFISFFTPEKKHDDLARSKTLWKIFLDTDGRRYEGKATKVKLLTSEVASLYPQHNSFSTPYRILFPVPLSIVEGKVNTLTITGPVGSATMVFGGESSKK